MDGTQFTPQPTKAPSGYVWDSKPWRSYAEAIGYDAESYGDDAFAVFLHDECGDCERCERRFVCDDLSSDWLCDDCCGAPSRASRLTRDPDERGDR